MEQSVKLYLVRHGRPSAGFGEAIDPGLDEIGREQAEAAAQALASIGPLSMLTSPLRRARETAAPLERLWKVTARVEPAVAELPTPSATPQERSAWLRMRLKGRWNELPMLHQQWREQVVATLVSLPTSTVITTHFIAINVAVGAALGDDRLICCEPDHCACTILEVKNGQLQLVALGRQRETQIL